jgi:hypothetical protein
VSATFHEEMRKPLTAGTMRTYVEEFDDLREALRETQIDDPYTTLRVQVLFDCTVITSAWGSVDLCLSAISEALRVIAPLVIPQSLVRIEVASAGTRRGWLVP